jgi:AraC-like DNA-binding protein
VTPRFTGLRDVLGSACPVHPCQQRREDRPVRPWSLPLQTFFGGRRAVHARAKSRTLSYALDDRRLQRVLQFVDTNLQNAIRLKDLAAVAYLSPFHFSRAFRAATGQSPHRLLRERRIEKAKQLIVQGTASLAEIALICGFSSQASFTRAFTRAVGSPPGQYRAAQEMARRSN